MTMKSPNAVGSIAPTPEEEAETTLCEIDDLLGKKTDEISADARKKIDLLFGSIILPCPLNDWSNDVLKHYRRVLKRLAKLFNAERPTTPERDEQTEEPETDDSTENNQLKYYKGKEIREALLDRLGEEYEELLKNKKVKGAFGKISTEAHTGDIKTRACGYIRGVNRVRKHLESDQEVICSALIELIIDLDNEITEDDLRKAEVAVREKEEKKKRKKDKKKDKGKDKKKKKDKDNEEDEDIDMSGFHERFPDGNDSYLEGDPEADEEE